MTLRSALDTMAEWIGGRDLATQPPARFDRIKRHILDTVGAQLAGSRIAEGRAVGRVATSLQDPVGAAIVARCAQARCTEIDDIHLTSCTTPGAVVVPTALALASEGHIQTTGELCAVVLAGYESLIRLGVALDGPVALHRQVWPTHAAAAFGAAATASRAYGLSVEQTAGALGTALAGGSGPPVPAGPSWSSRWLTLGMAAANGEFAARAAREGLLGAVGVTAPCPPRLATGIDRRHLSDEVGMKPFPTSRQGLAAVAAATAMVRTHRLLPDDIDRIAVGLPELQRRIVDRPEMPASRFGSLVSVHYQIALAIVAPERLADVERTPLFASDSLRQLMSKIEVHRARDLDPRYPRAWPARVDIEARGRRHSRLVLHPPGDARRPFSWDQVALKFAELAGPVIGDGTARRVAQDLKDADADARIQELWTLG